MTACSLAVESRFAVAKQVTIYVDPELHTAFKHLAVSAGGTVSELVTDAMRAYLAANDMGRTPRRPIPRRTSERSRPVPPDASPPPTMSEMAAELTQQSRLLSAIQNRLDALPVGVEAGGAYIPLDPGVVAARKAIMAMMREAGADGVLAADLQRRLSEDGVTFASSRTALADLRKGKVLRRTRYRWKLTGDAKRVDPAARRGGL